MFRQADYRQNSRKLKRRVSRRARTNDRAAKRVNSYFEYIMCFLLVCTKLGKTRIKALVSLGEFRLASFRDIGCSLRSTGDEMPVVHGRRWRGGISFSVWSELRDRASEYLFNAAARACGSSCRASPLEATTCVTRPRIGYASLRCGGGRACRRPLSSRCMAWGERKPPIMRARMTLSSSKALYAWSLTTFGRLNNLLSSA